METYFLKGNNALKVYRGIVKDKYDLLEEKPDLPDDCRALAEIKPVGEARDQEIARRHIALLKKAPRVGKLLTRNASSFMTGELRLIDTNVLVHALLFPKSRREDC